MAKTAEKVTGKASKNVENLPDYIEIDIDSPLENFLSLSVFFHGIFAFLVSGGMYLAISKLLPARAMVGVYFICAVHGTFFAVLFFLRRGLRCYYLLNRAEKKIEYVRSIAGKIFKVDFLRFEEIEVVAATGIRKRTTRPPIDKWYSYTVCLLDKSGMAYEFSRESRELENQKKAAERIADFTGCHLIECLPERVIKTVKTGDKVQVELVHQPISEFSGVLMPFEASRQLINTPIIAGSFLFSSAIVIFGTVFLLGILAHMVQ